MQYVFKLSFLLFIIAQVVLDSRSPLMEVIILLAVTAVNIIRVRYTDSIYTVLIEYVVIGAAVLFINPYFIFLYGALIYDIVYKKLYAGILPALALALYMLDISTLLQYLLVISICIGFALVSQRLAEKETLFKNTFDKERAYRYELEQMKQKLLVSSREIAHIAEIKERNRIAREIHDNIGHSIAGILMLLQASKKLVQRDKEKSEVLMEKAIEELSKALTVMRETVHNIKPKENLGIEYIQHIIDNFSFCRVDFSCSGDFNALPANYIEILSSNIKEALTNASRYSNATQVEVRMEVNDQFVRLYIKDNGEGCTKIKEGLGLSGMRERVENMGGNLSVSSSNGFLIVCIIPREMRKSGDRYESSDR